MTGRGRCALLLAALVVLAASPASAGPEGLDTSSPLWTPQPIPRTVTTAGAVDAAGAYRAADTLRAAGATGSLAQLLRASAGVAGWELPDGPGGATGLAPRGLAQPIAALVDDVLAAEQLMRAQSTFVPADAATRALRIDPHDSGALEGLAGATRGLDLPAITAASVRIAAAIDALVASVPAVPARAGPAAAECDVYELRPILCIGGGAPNTYVTDFQVSVDLGGDDTYTNGAGVGACLAAGVANTRCVGVAVDLGGDDVYAAVESLRCGTATCGQGVGSVGIGMLVDADGDDSYTTIGSLGAAGCSDTQWCGFLAAQGTGSVGVGVLADLAGDDAYVARFLRHAVGPDGIEAPEGISAQGVAILGAGLLWDAAGDDSYEVRGHATGYVDPDAFHPWSMVGTSGALAQGAVLAGAGGMVEGGGTDRLVIAMEADPDAALATRPSPWGQGGRATIAGQGFAESFADEPMYGGLVTGPGDTQYVVGVEARLGAAAATFAQGSGLFGRANGFLDDAGGNDVYQLSSETDLRLETRCACQTARAVFDTLADPFLRASDLGQSTVRGQGSYQGVLRDRSGDDRYEAFARTTVAIEAASTLPGGRATAGATLFGTATVHAQADQPGVLRDDAGNDVYLMDAERDVEVTAVAAPAADGSRSESAWAFPGYVTIVGQGRGLVGDGELTDRGGQDRYLARTRGTGRAFPPAPGRAGDGIAGVAVQGADGTLTDADAGQLDSFDADSPLVFDVCAGRYGEAPGWVSGPTLRSGACSPTWGSSVATTTVAPGVDTRAVFLGVTPTGDALFPALDVEVRLEDAAGTPLPRRRVTVVSEHGYTTLDPLVDQLFPWVDATLSAVNLVADESGVARGTMPMRLLACDPSSCAGLTGDVRLRAMFFGESGRYRPGQGYLDVTPPG